MKKRLSQQKKDAYKAEATRIKLMPPKERVAARKEARTRVKKAYDAKIAMLPALGRRNYNEVVALINRINKIKW